MPDCPYCAEPLTAATAERCERCGERLVEPAASPPYRLKTFGLALGITALLLVGVCLLLAGAGAIAYRGNRAAMNQQKAQLDMYELLAVMERMQLDTGTPPTRLDDLLVAPAGAQGWSGPYVSSARLLDPWGNPYLFQPGEPGTLTSQGADGAPGGSGEAADIIVTR